MPQQHLHHAEVRAVIEQVGREGVAQGVRRQLFRDANLARIALDDVPGGGAFGRPEWAESYTIAAERPLGSIRSLSSQWRTWSEL